MDYAVKRAAQGSFTDVTEAVEASIEAHGFVIVGSHDVHHTLARKGFDIRPVRIYELRDADAASEHAAGRSSSDATLIPGRVSVFEEGGELIVAAIRPGIVSEMFPGSNLEAEAADVERRLVSVVERVVGR